MLCLWCGVWLVAIFSHNPSSNRSNAVLSLGCGISGPPMHYVVEGWVNCQPPNGFSCQRHENPLVWACKAAALVIVHTVLDFACRAQPVIHAICDTYHHAPQCDTGKSANNYHCYDTVKAMMLMCHGYCDTIKTTIEKLSKLLLHPWHGMWVAFLHWINSLALPIIHGGMLRCSHH